MAGGSRGREIFCILKDIGCIEGFKAIVFKVPVRGVIGGTEEEEISPFYDAAFRYGCGGL